MIKVKDRDKLPQPTDQSFPLTHCKERDANDCWFYFTFSVRNDTNEVVVVEQLGEAQLTQALVTLSCTKQQAKSWTFVSIFD